MAKQPQDDLFEGATMTFGEHLEELRVCLFRSILGIVIGCLIGLFVAEKVVRFFEGPLERALRGFYLARALEEIKGDFAGSVPIEYERAVLLDQLVPERMNVEPAQLTDQLSHAFPDLLNVSPLSHHLFVPADLKDEGSGLGLARLLASQEKKSTASPPKRVWEMLSDEQQAQIKQLAEANKPLTSAEQGLLLAALNSLLPRTELHDSREFGNLTGDAPDTVKTLRQRLTNEKNIEDTRRLNKFLLGEAFDDYLRTTRINLVTFYNWKPVKVRFQVLSAQEAFMIYLKAALLTGVVLASPWVFYQIWIFVAAGLYPHEKNQVYIYLPISVALFLGGASLAFGFVFEPVLNFLFRFNQGLNAEFDPRIGEWLSFVLILPLGFGISFQLPLVMLFINRLGLVSIDVYMQQWRMAILVIFIVAMILTPADPVSMLLMAIPLCGLYVLGIAMCVWMPKTRSPFDTAYEPGT
jgi:sec-independent protein translocase protein TatC